MMKWLKEFLRSLWLFIRSHEQEYKPLPKPIEPPASIDQTLGIVEPKLKNPKWYDLALKYLGKNEHDKEFDKFLSNFWNIVGLKGFKTIIGSNYAWCGLFVAVMLYLAGFGYAKNGAGAKNWSQFGTKIEYIKKGIPHGAIVRINHGFDCSSSKGNHVAFACGNYRPSDFISDGKLKQGASITLLGGNQSDSVKFSKYDMREICTVSWVSEELPPEVTETVPCDTNAKPGDKTQ